MCINVVGIEDSYKVTCCGRDPFVHAIVKPLVGLGNHGRDALSVRLDCGQCAVGGCTVDDDVLQFKGIARLV